MAQGPSHVYTLLAGVAPLEGLAPLGLAPEGPGPEQQYHETWGQANELPLKSGTLIWGVPPKQGPQNGSQIP